MLDRLGDIAPSDSLVPNSEEEPFSSFSQQHELLNAVGLGIAFEPGDELAPHATLLITGCNHQRAQEGARVEALNTDDSDQCFLGLKYP